MLKSSIIPGTGCFILFFTLLSGIQKLHAQDDKSVTVYQYRHVPDDKVNEFVRRETTYWTKVAEHATKNKSMTFWALLEKIGGTDLSTNSNFLFINTFPNIDNVDTVFSVAEKVTGQPLSKIETNSMSTTTSEFFLHDENWQQVADANPMKDFNYIIMIYHNSNSPDSVIGLEKQYWSPFIKKAMDSKQTPQKAWGNARVLSPSGENIKMTSVSYDIFATLQDALMPTWDPKAEIPTDGLSKITGLELNRRGEAIYRVIKVVAAN